MPSVYVTEQGSCLRISGNRLVVERDGVTLASIHDFRISRLVIVGNVQLSTQAIGLLLERGVDTTFLSVHGRLKGQLLAVDATRSPVRIRQYQRASDAAFRLAAARRIVGAKIANSRDVLARYCHNHPDLQLGDTMRRLDRFVRRAADAASVEGLLGIEGSAAAVYFPAFGKTLRRGSGFTKRGRRPPPDPVNAMLSFGYAMLAGEAVGALAATGLDPCLGLFHAVESGRYSLALDLMEEFRPVVVDRVVHAVTNLGVMTPPDFEPGPSGGVYLSVTGRKRFVTHFERTMMSARHDAGNGAQATVRGQLHQQAELMRRAIVDEGRYEPSRGWR